jgi:hypothetical protein
VNSKRSSVSSNPDPKKEFDDYAAAARTLESHHLLFLLGYSLLMTQKYSKLEGREERREILRQELVRRAIDPYRFTIEDFRDIFRPRAIKEEEREQQLRGCINLLQRAIAREGSLTR